MSIAVEDLTRTATAGLERRSKFLDGAEFGLDLPSAMPTVWGRGSEVLWSRGEYSLLVGPDGVGKTTLTLWVVLALAGIVPEVLGYRVEPTAARVGLIAADRPEQIRRRFAGFVTEAERDALADRLIVWRGPLEFDVTERGRLSSWCRDLGISALVIDSLGALVPGLAKDEVGHGVAIALSSTVADGVDVLALYHPRKETSDNKKPNRLADVYGSRWLTALSGSVVSLWGDPGDPVVELRHLKQPLSEVGPFQVATDEYGYPTVMQGTDLLAALRAAPLGLAARAAARALYGDKEPNRAQTEKARRKLEALRSRKLARRIDGAGIREPSTYFATERREP